jgi:hypothetical protein
VLSYPLTHVASSIMQGSQALRLRKSAVFGLLWFVMYFALTAQNATLVKQLSTGVNTWDFTPTAFNGSVCFIDNALGPLAGHVGSDQLTSAMHPSLLVRYERIIYGAFVGPDRVWVNGVPKAGRPLESATIAESTDRGSTWSLVDSGRLDGRTTFPDEQSALLCDLQYDGYTRFADLYSADGGARWSYVPVPDSLGRPEQGDYCYLGDGVWAFYSTTVNRWYQLDLHAKAWVNSAIPAEVRVIYGLPSGIRIGIKGVPPKQSFVYWTPSVRIYRDTSIIVDGRVVADSTWVSKFTHIRGGGIVAVIADGLQTNTLISWSDDAIRVFFPDSVKTGYAAWSLPTYGGHGTISDKNVVYVKLAAASGPPPMKRDFTYYLDVDSGRLQELETLPFTYSPRFMHEGMSYENVQGKYILQRGYNQARVTILGEIADPYSRARPIGFNCVVSTKAGFNAIRDQWGDVASLAQDGKVELHAKQLDGFRRRYDAEQNYVVDPFVSLRLGEENLWEPHGIHADSVPLHILSGGAKLIGIDTAGQHHTIVSDTTTAWHVGGSGTSYSAYRYIRMRTPDNQSGILQIPSRGEAAISSIVEVDTTKLIIGLRGYIVDRQAAQDTVKGGILYSDDGGFTWTEASSDLEALPHALVTSISRRPADGSLWASATWATMDARDTLSDPSIDQDKFALLKSEDGGHSWVTVQEVGYRGPWRSSASNVVSSVGDIVAWAAFDRVLYSSDGGGSFTLVEGLHGLTLRVGSISLDPTGRLLIATNQGLYAVPPVNVSVNEPVERSYPAFWASTYPNPTTGKLTVRVQNIQAAGGPIERLEIVDLFGRSVFNKQTELDKVNSLPGQDVLEFDTDLSDQPGGVYFLVGVTHNRNTLWKVLIAR